MSQSTSTTRSGTPPVFAGIDVGGTTIKLALVSDHGQLMATEHFPTEDELGVPDAVSRMRRGLERLCATANLNFSDIAAIGLGGDVPLNAWRISSPLGLALSIGLLL